MLRDAGEVVNQPKDEQPKDELKFVVCAITRIRETSLGVNRDQVLAARQHKGVIAAAGDEKTQGCVAAVQFQADGLAIDQR